jgi:putative two-component system response regulator
MSRFTQKPTVMIVDDMPADLDLLDQMLRAQGYRVLTFPLGRLALEAAAETPPDLILLDFTMPEMDGIEVCRSLKADPRLMEIPVIFLGSSGENEERVRAFAAGGSDYLAKPFQEEEIHTKVRTYLRMMEMQHALRNRGGNGA